MCQTIQSGQCCAEAGRYREGRTERAQMGSGRAARSARRITGTTPPGEVLAGLRDRQNRRTDSVVDRTGGRGLDGMTFEYLQNAIKS